MYTQFWPKTAFFWSRGANFDPKPQKYSKTSCYNPKPCIPGQKVVSERLCHFWGLQAPQPHSLAPPDPPMVPGGQKWPKCTCTSPVLIINDKKTTFGRVNILTYFFTRNVPDEKCKRADLSIIWQCFIVQKSTFCPIHCL